MKFTSLIVALLIGLVSRVAAADTPPVANPPTDPVLFDHVKVDDAFAKGLPLLVNSSYKIQASRRVVAGQAEVHASDTDIFYVTEGSATIVTGGKVDGGKEAGLGETRGDKITGGTPRHLAKGDVFVVPAGVPHWFSEVNGTFVALVIKVTK